MRVGLTRAMLLSAALDIFIDFGNFGFEFSLKFIGALMFGHHSKKFLGEPKFFAGIAFIFKLTEFIYVATNEGPDAMGTFLIPVMNYLLVAAGFLCMFFWAYFTGQYRDVEAPKYRMLEMQAEIDREEGARS